MGSDPFNCYQISKLHLTMGYGHAVLAVVTLATCIGIIASMADAKKRIPDILRFSFVFIFVDIGTAICIETYGIAQKSGCSGSAPISTSNWVVLGTVFLSLVLGILAIKRGLYIRKAMYAFLIISAMPVTFLFIVALSIVTARLMAIKLSAPLSPYWFVACATLTLPAVISLSYAAKRYNLTNRIIIIFGMICLWISFPLIQFVNRM